MLTEPTLYTMNQLRHEIPTMPQSKSFRIVDVKGGQEKQEGWTPARNETFRGLALRKRFKLAFMVFIGRADAVIWDKAYPSDKYKLVDE